MRSRDRSALDRRRLGSKGRRGRGNARNGSIFKTMQSGVGPMPLQVPRDRAGTFEPLPTPKRAGRTALARHRQHPGRKSPRARPPPPDWQALRPARPHCRRPESHGMARSAQRTRHRSSRPHRLEHQLSQINQKSIHLRLRSQLRQFRDKTDRAECLETAAVVDPRALEVTHGFYGLVLTWHGVAVVSNCREGQRP